MTKNYEEIYNKKMKELSNKTSTYDIDNVINMKKISNKKIEEIYDKLTNVIEGKKPYPDFSFPQTGKILGILRFININRKHIDKLLDIVGLPREIIDTYASVCGNTPYYEAESGTINPGRQMIPELAKELISITAVHLGVYIDDSDLSEITQERWDNICNKKLKEVRAEANMFKNMEKVQEYSDE